MGWTGSGAGKIGNAGMQPCRLDVTGRGEDVAAAEQNTTIADSGIGEKSHCPKTIAYRVERGGANT